MLQNCDNSWNQPLALPPLVKPSNEGDRPSCEAAGQVAPAGPGEEQRPTETPLSFPGEDDQWMLLL